MGCRVGGIGRACCIADHQQPAAVSAATNQAQYVEERVSLSSLYVLLSAPRKLLSLAQQHKHEHEQKHVFTTTPGCCEEGGTTEWH